MDLTVDGRRVFAATGGRPFSADRPVVVLVHGAGMDHTVWSLQARWLAHHGRSVLAVDLPGHGRSEGPALAGIGAMADWLLALLDAAGCDQAALAGHSMGALVALEAAGRAPQRLPGLALLGLVPEMGVHPALQAAAEADDHAAIDMIVLWGHGAPARIGGNRAPGLWMTGGAVRLLERSAPGVLAADLSACSGYKGALAAAGKITCPVAVILGAIDQMTPARRAKPLAEAIAGAGTVIIPGCGHMMMLERPDETLDAMRTVL